VDLEEREADEVSSDGPGAVDPGLDEPAPDEDGTDEASRPDELHSEQTSPDPSVVAAAEGVERPTGATGRRARRAAPERSADAGRERPRRFGGSRRRSTPAAPPPRRPPRTVAELVAERERAAVERAAQERDGE